MKRRAGSSLSRWVSVGFFLGVGAAGCRSTDAAEGSTAADLTQVSNATELFDVNDVSILFARAENGGMIPDIRVTEKDDAGNELWGRQAFDDVMTFVKGSGEADPRVELRDGRDDPAAWRLVGVRFSPCGPALTPTPDPDTAKRMRVLGIPGCLVQVRMVAQPFDETNGFLNDTDVAAHLVYSVGPLTGDVPDAVKADVAVLQDQMVDDLRTIKRLSAESGASTIGEPLGAHPGLRREGETGGRKVADAVKAWIKKYVARAPQLREITFMGTRGVESTWVFAGGAIEEGRWRAKALPSFIDFDHPESAATTPKHMRLLAVDDAARPNGVIVGADRVLLTDSSAAPSSSVNVASLLQLALAKDHALDEAEQKAAARTAFAIDDPGKAHLLNTDCVSCHASTAVIAGLGIRSTADRPRVPRGITGYVALDGQLSGTPWNTRSFGYFGSIPAISLRAVNETVRVVEMLNLAAQSDKPEAARLPGPGRDCTANDDAVFHCFTHGICDQDFFEPKKSILRTCGKLLSD